MTAAIAKGIPGAKIAAMFVRLTLVVIAKRKTIGAAGYLYWLYCLFLAVDSAGLAGEAKAIVTVMENQGPAAGYLLF